MVISGFLASFIEIISAEVVGLLMTSIIPRGCCAHILNLIVGEGLKETDTSVARVREAVRYVKS